jgi:hypothetical protein
MRKKCTRRHYALSNPITLAIEGACVSQNSELDKLREREKQSIDALAQGVGTIGHLRAVEAMLMISRSMAEAGIGRDEVLLISAIAGSHLKDDEARYEQTGRMGTTGLGLKAYRDLFEYHDLQRLSVARSEYEKHIAKAFNRRRSASSEAA